jgi:hypothetical protein
MERLKIRHAGENRHPGGAGESIQSLDAGLRRHDEEEVDF